MNRLDREWEIKLDLLASIARSQESLALMLEQAAKVAIAVDMPPAVLREHIRALSGMQEALLTAATGTRWRKPRQGSPCAPWLSGKASVVGKQDGKVSVVGKRMGKVSVGDRIKKAGGVAW